MAIDDHRRERATSNRSGRGGWEPGYGPEGWDRDYPREGRFDPSHGPDYTRSDERISEDACECLTRHPGIDASAVRHLWEAGRLGLGETDTERMQFPALSLDEAAEAFTQLAYGKAITLQGA